MNNMNVLRRPEVENRVQLSTATIYRMIAEGKFPKQIRLGARSVGWLESDINNWLNDLKKQTEAA